MTDTLATYLHDHLAGAEHALETLQNIGERHANEPLGQFAAELHGEIDADRNVLRGLAERIGAGSSKVKEMGAWVSEKMSRIKLTGLIGLRRSSACPHLNATSLFATTRGPPMPRGLLARAMVRANCTRGCNSFRARPVWARRCASTSRAAWISVSTGLRLWFIRMQCGTDTCSPRTLKPS